MSLLNCIAFICDRHGLDTNQEVALLKKENLWFEDIKKKASAKAKKSETPKKTQTYTHVTVNGKKVSLPFNGTIMNDCCKAIKKNNGLYTQCEKPMKKECDYCAICQKNMEKDGLDEPTLGRIEQRMDCAIMEYVNRNGEKPVYYMEYLRKQKVDASQVFQEIHKLNINLHEVHTIAPPTKTQKGRPKKTNKPVEINQDEDIFAAVVRSVVEEATIVQEEAPVVQEEAPVVQQAPVVQEEEPVVQQTAPAKKTTKAKANKMTAEEKEAEKKKKAEEKEAEKKKKAEEKEAEKKKKAAEKKTTEKKNTQKKKQEPPAIVQPEPEPESEAEENPDKKYGEEEEEGEIELIQFKFEDSTYLRDDLTGIVYDYQVYTKTGGLEAIGSWNTATKKIFFKNTSDDMSELSEEEYD